MTGKLNIHNPSAWGMEPEETDMSRLWRAQCGSYGTLGTEGAQVKLVFAHPYQGFTGPTVISTSLITAAWRFP